MKFITPPCRSVYMQVNELRAAEYQDEDGNKQISDTKTGQCRLIISKRRKGLIKKIEKAIKQTVISRYGETEASKIMRHSRFHNPLSDCDEAIDQGDITGSFVDVQKNHYSIKATCYNIPGLVDEEGVAVDDWAAREELTKSGYWFQFSLNFKNFSKKLKGVRVEISNLKFVKEDDVLDGGVNAEDEEWGSASEDSDMEDDDTYSRPKRKTRLSKRHRDEIDDDEDEIDDDEDEIDDDEDDVTPSRSRKKRPPSRSRRVSSRRRDIDIDDEDDDDDTIDFDDDVGMSSKASRPSRTRSSRRSSRSVRR